MQNTDTAFAQAMSANMRAKCSFFARQLPNMSLQYINAVQYVDSGYPSDTFNTVFGIPSCTEEVAEVTDVYQKQNRPAAWWLPKSANNQAPMTTIDRTVKDLTDNNCQWLQSSGWSYQEHDIGMYLELSRTITPPKPVLSHIKSLNLPAHFQHFGYVLSSLFATDNPTEAAGVKDVYHWVGQNSTLLSHDMIHLVGYYGDCPVATASLYLQKDIAGIYDIATLRCWRNRGFGSEMLYQALLSAQRKGAIACVLQASPEGLNLYKRAGFVGCCGFDVWSLSQHP